MESLYRYVASPSACGYLPDRQARLEYEYVGQMTPAEYQRRLLENWRRFGRVMFRPLCDGCTLCRSLRVRAADFRPNRSQRRARKLNEGAVELRIGKPSVTREKLNLYDRYHAHQAQAKGWPSHAPRDASSYAESFVNQPFPVEEWCYYLEGRLVGVGYVDVLPPAVEEGDPTSIALEGGLSAIYFFYDPDEKPRSLGVWNVLNVIEQTARRGLPWAYLGYYVQGCPSVEYKLGYTPNQVRGTDGVWRDACP